MCLNSEFYTNETRGVLVSSLFEDRKPLRSFSLKEQHKVVISPQDVNKVLVHVAAFRQKCHVFRRQMRRRVNLVEDLRDAKWSFLNITNFCIKRQAIPASFWRCWRIVCSLIVPRKLKMFPELHVDDESKRRNESKDHEHTKSFSMRKHHYLK